MTRFLRLTFGLNVFLLIYLSCERKPAVHREIETALRPFDAAGAVVFFGHDGKITQKVALGYSNPAEKRHTTVQTFYRVASLSKMVTAAAVMKLVEDGRIDLDRDISAYFGVSIKNPSHPETAITARMLLSHTSGLKDGEAYNRFIESTFDENGPELLQDFLVSKADSLFSDKKPGAWFSYCNFAYVVLGTLVEKTGGQAFGDFCEEYLFDPLEIEASFDPGKLPAEADLAVLVRKTDSVWVPQADDFPTGRKSLPVLKTYRPGTNALVYGPQGGLRTNAEGMFYLLDLFRNNGNVLGRQILRPETVEMMKTPHWIFDGSNGETYSGLFNAWGLGLHLTGYGEKDQVFPGAKMFGHPGEAYGLLSDAYSDGEKTLVFITNGIGNPPQSGKRTAFYAPEEVVFDVVYEFSKR